MAQRANPHASRSSDGLINLRRHMNVILTQIVVAMVLWKHALSAAANVMAGDVISSCPSQQIKNSTPYELWMH